MRPVVSIVIRAFNCERYVGQAIESLLYQTFQDFEIVIVNDASTDGTAAVLQTYAEQDERIRVIKNETNQGPVRTMNIGLQHARGEFIAVNDDNDISLPHRLETQVNFLRANLNIALMGTRAYTIDEDGEEIEDAPREGRKGTEEVRQFLEQGHSLMHSSLMYRRECIEAIGLYDEEFFASSEDYDMLIRMADAFEIVCYEEPLVKWRLLNSGITGRQKRMQAAYAELARVRSKAKKEERPLDLQQEYKRITASEAITSGIFRNQPISDTHYYYIIGRMLLNNGKPRQARKRFLQALKHRDEINICLRTFIMYILSFFPNSINPKLRQVLRKLS